MNKTTLQIPMAPELRKKSEKIAFDMGFSSLQEVIRLFLSRFAAGDITINFDYPQVKLSAKSQKRYQKITQDYKNARNITKTSSLHDFFDKLNQRFRSNTIGTFRSITKNALKIILNWISFFINGSNNSSSTLTVPGLTTISSSAN